MPPLKEITLQTVQPATKHFLDSMINNVSKGNWEQMQQIDVCMGKIIRLSIFVMKLIQNIIEKAQPILMNMNREPFIDNVCCNEKYVGVMEYLTSKDASIMKLNQSISVLTNYIFTIQNMQKAKYLFDPTDTRQHYLVPPTAFSESVIYQAFIVYCKYNKNIPLLNEQLLALCDDNVSEFTDTDDLDTRVKTMKSEGKIYSEIALNQLMAIINRSNIIHEDIEHTEPGLNTQFRAVLESIKNDPIPTVPMSIVEALFADLDTFEIASSAEGQGSRKIKDTLHELNDSYVEEINSFMTKHGRLSLQKRKMVKKFFNSLDKWSYSTSEELSPEETAVFRLTDFLQTFIENITVIYPETILHKVGYTESTRHIKTWDKEISVSLLPRTMKVSYLHELDIKKFIKSYYADLQNIYASKNDEILTSILHQVMINTASIQAMSKCTPRFTPFTTDTGVMKHPIDMHMVAQLYKFYVLAILRKYIHVAKDMEPVLRTPLSRPTADATQTTVENMAEMEIVAGDIKHTNVVIAELLSAYMTMYTKDRADIDLSYDEIMEKVLRSKEKEKDEMTTYLKDLTDEEREIENIHKNNKLGKWGVGLTRSVVHYDADAYDHDRDKMEKRLELNAKLGRLDVVDTMHLDIFEIEQLEREQANDEIEAEEWNMNELANDDDPEGDGDEYY